MKKDIKKNSDLENHDIFSKTKRSQIMASVKGKNTFLEKKVFYFLRKKKLRFQRHYSKVAGKPDIAFPKHKKVIFIDSDFWHGWQYPRWKLKLTSDFWVKKIENNRKRDKKVNRLLRKQGWKILRIWEHEMKKDFDGAMGKIMKFLLNKKESTPKAL